MSDFGEEVYLDDALAEKVSQDIVLKSKKECVTLGAAAVAGHEYLFGLLLRMSKDFDHLVDDEDLIAVWDEVQDENEDPLLSIGDALEAYLDDSEKEKESCVLDSSANPFLYTAYLAFYALSFEREVPEVNNEVHDYLTCRWEGTPQEKAKLQAECLAALDKDKCLQYIIGEEVKSREVISSTTDNAHKKVAEALGAGAVSLILNKQSEFNALAGQQQQRRNMAYLN